MLRRVIGLLPGGAQDEWRLVFWFDLPSSYLKGRRPKGCLDGPVDDILDAARAEALGGARHA